MKPQQIVLVTGMSGAGKTSAMSVLEDLGYHCIDQYPVKLIDSLDEIIREDYDLRYRNICFATTALDYPRFITYFLSKDVDLKVIYLDASNEELLLRYKFTRRHHPFLLSNRANTLEEAIEVERSLFNNIFDVSMMHIDTTYKNTNDLKEQLHSRFSLNEAGSFAVSFVSFGFKHGVPLDSDLIFDMRILPNPFYIKELKPLTGNDESVYEYVMSANETKELMTNLEHYLDMTFASYASGAKNHITVGIGCTGGQHRSVSVANYLFKKYSEKYKCFVAHRDAVRG